VREELTMLGEQGADLAAALEQVRRQAEAEGTELWEWLARRLPESEKARLERGSRLWRILAGDNSPGSALRAE
jgi:hypothetical protein